jgi:hypothetical protein
MTHRNKQVLEQLLAKIDEELAEKEKCPARGKEAADKVLSSMGSTNIDDVFYAPKYEVPAGCPKIDLEVRTTSTRALYVIMDCKRGIDEQKLKHAVNSLNSSKNQTPDGTKLCVYFMDETARNRVFIEQHRKMFNKNGILVCYSGSPLPEPAGKYSK